MSLGCGWQLDATNDDRQFANTMIKDACLPSKNRRYPGVRARQQPAAVTYTGGFSTDFTHSCRRGTFYAPGKFSRLWSLLSVKADRSD